MLTGTNRRTFLRGAAGAVGMGAVGALSSKLQFVRAAEPLARRTVTIYVYYVEGRLRCSDQIAERGDTVVWVPATGVDCIRQVVFKGPRSSPSPFPQVILPGGCSETNKKVSGNVRGNAERKKYVYLIAAKVDDRTETLDPDLDII